MKVRNSKGELKEIVIKANDSIPAGSVIDFDGDVVPEGYEKVEDKGEVYSTEEQRIGTWNGKKLYRKTIEIDTSSSFTNSTLTKYEHKIANIEKIIKATSTAKTSWGGGWFTDITLAINKFQIRADETYLYIKNDSGSDYKLEYLAVILEYTKTTD